MLNSIKTPPFTEHKFLTIYEEVDEWLKLYDVKNYIIDPTTLEVDVDNNVILSHLNLLYIPVQFNKVYGDVDITHNKLTTLKGSPKNVKGYFDCSNNYLTSLKYSPNIIECGFYCVDNNLNTLDYSPKIVNGSYMCCMNDIIDISNLHKYCKSIHGHIELPGSIKYGLLSVLLIKNIKAIVFNDKHIQNIINKHLKSNRSITACQMELIDKGSGDYATL